MVLPGKQVTLRSEPLVLSGDEVRLLNEQLAKMRHDVNNQLAVLVAAIDLIRYKPESAQKWLNTINDQPANIGDCIRAFSALFEEMLGINRPPAPPPGRSDEAYPT